MSTKTVTYINIEPNWRGILPALLALLENPSTHQTALDELTRMARLADERVAQLKADDK